MTLTLNSAKQVLPMGDTLFYVTWVGDSCVTYICYLYYVIFQVSMLVLPSTPKYHPQSFWTDSKYHFCTMFALPCAPCWPALVLVTYFIISLSSNDHSMCVLVYEGEDLLQTYFQWFAFTFLLTILMQKGKRAFHLKFTFTSLPLQCLTYDPSWL